MANVMVTVLGGQPQLKQAETVAELAELLGLGESHKVKVGGNEADYSTELEEGNFVTFGEKMKGGSH